LVSELVKTNCEFLATEHSTDSLLIADISVILTFEKKLDVTDLI